MSLRLGATELNYPQQTTDASGFFTVTVSGSLLGTAVWRVMGPDGVSGGNVTSGFLANCGTVELTGASQTNMNNDEVLLPACPAGCIRGGDSNNSNIVNVSDFSILKGQFGQAGTNIGDANNDLVVNVSDFNIQKANFGQAGCSAILAPGERK